MVGCGGGRVVEWGEEWLGVGGGRVVECGGRVVSVRGGGRVVSVRGASGECERGEW